MKFDIENFKSAVKHLRFSMKTSLWHLYFT